METAWHAKKRAELLDMFSVNEVYGLSKEEVNTRLRTYGPNAFKESDGTFWVSTLIKQCTSPLVIILFIACLGAWYLGEKFDALVILIALVVNIVISFAQEFRANKALKALAASQEEKATVLRDGVKDAVLSHELVPGDIVFLSSGSVVPADGRMLSGADFSVSEAHITGESLSITKKPEAIPLESEVYERTNMLYMGSPVLTGEARMLVVTTGGKTQVGEIAESLSVAHGADTPIEKSIRKLAHFLSIIVAIVVGILIVVGVMRGMPLTEVLLLAIALAVSVIPEGLPAAVTAILAIGMERILKKRGLVRNILAAETLGSTTIVLTDKTGTLTQSRLALVDVVYGEERGFSGLQLSEGQTKVLAHAVRVSDAVAKSSNESGGAPEFDGGPMGRALISAALERELFEDVFTELEKRTDFLRFSSEKRFSGAVYENKNTTSPYTAYFLGAPELLIESCSKIIEDGKEITLDSHHKESLQKTVSALAHEGKRIIAVAYTPTNHKELPRDTAVVHQGAIFLGLLAFADPVRADVPEAVVRVQEAGVRVVMVTGDNPETAYSIAVSAGVAHEGEVPVSGKDIEGMDDDALYDALMTRHVFARVLPKQKQRLVSVLQNRGEVVAMTGDGVNDAPALKTASIGVAVGSGTSVAREASDLVLLDDSFSIIVSAIQEGRRILDNLKKATVHLITTSFHEVFLISVAIIAGLPLPILPLQILWVNILEEGFLTFGFAFEPGEKKSMTLSPQALRGRTILTKEVRRLIIAAGIITGIFSVLVYLFLLSQGLPIEEIRTVMFVMLALDAIMFAVSLKQLRQPFWKGELFNNRYLVAALTFSMVGVLGTLYIPPLRDALDLVPLHLFDVGVLAVVALVNLLTIEGMKYFTTERAFISETKRA